MSLSLSVCVSFCPTTQKPSCSSSSPFLPSHGRNLLPISSSLLFAVKISKGTFSPLSIWVQEKGRAAAITRGGGGGEEKEEKEEEEEEGGQRDHSSDAQFCPPPFFFLCFNFLVPDGDVQIRVYSSSISFFFAGRQTQFLRSGAKKKVSLRWKVLFLSLSHFSSWRETSSTCWIHLRVSFKWVTKKRRRRRR